MSQDQPMESTEPTTGQFGGPQLRILRGDPTDEELVALVTVLTTRTAAARPDASTRRGWSGYWRSLGDDA